MDDLGYEDDNLNYEADLLDKISDICGKLQSSTDIFRILTIGKEYLDSTDFCSLLSSYSSLSGLVSLLKLYNANFYDNDFRKAETFFETNLNKIEDLLNKEIENLLRIKDAYKELIKYP